MRTRKLGLLILPVVLAALLLAPATALGEGFVNTLKWSTDGTLAGQVGTVPGLCVHNGQVYATDYVGARVVVFTTDGSYVRQWACVSSATGIAIDRATETVYVGSYNGGINRYTLAGDPLGEFVANGTGATQVGGVEGLALDSAGNLYATDVANARVQVYSSAGAHLRTIGSPGTADGQFGLPGGIGLDAAGNVYVMDFTLSRVQKFTSTGTFLARWGSAGSGDGQFSQAVLLAVDGRDHVFVTDRANNRVQEFTSAGTHVRNITLAGLTTPHGITIGPRNSLFVARNGSGTKLFRWDWDATAPVITHDYDGEWHSQPFNVTFTAKDDYTDVPWLRWSLNSVDWTNNGSVTVPVNAITHAWDGFYKVTIGAGDSVSNWAYKTLPVKIDTRAPISTASGVPSGWTTQEVWVDIAATDVGSGVHRTFYDLDGAGLTELSDTGRVIVGTSGAHTLQYFSQDNCADTPNEETAKTVQVLIDMMGPDVIPTNNVSVRRGARATFKYTLNDDWSPTCTVKLVIKKKTKVVKTVNLGVKNSSLQVPPHAYSKAFAVSLPVGAYTWTVSATDLAGNKGSWEPKRLTVK